MRLSNTDVSLASATAGGGGATRLSEGVLVEASVVVRLLKLKLLTLDATIVLVPFDGKVAAAPVAPAAPPPLDPAAAQVSRTAVRAAPSGGRSGLSEARRRLDEGADLLTRARAASTSLPGPRTL